MRLPLKHRSSDMQLLDVEQAASPGVQGNTGTMGRAERSDKSLEDDTSGTLSVASAASMV